MSEKSNHEDPQTQALRDELERTREELARKLEMLQDRLTQSVQTTRTNVEGTMNTVKQTARDALHSMKMIYDLKQAGKHPWSVAGIVSCVGVMLAQRGYRHVQAMRTNAQAPADAPPPPPVVDEPQAAINAEPPSTKKWLGSRLRTELSKLQGAAIGVGVDLLRDWAKRKSTGDKRP